MRQVAVVDMEREKGRVGRGGHEGDQRTLHHHRP